MVRAAIVVGHAEGIVKYLHPKRQLKVEPRYFESEGMAELYLASLAHILADHGFTAYVEVKPE